MATFYGMIEGSRGSVTRTGTKASGFKAAAQSYDGSVVVRLRYNKEDKLIVDIETADDSTSFFTETNFSGTLDELREALADWKEKKHAKANSD